MGRSRRSRGQAEQNFTSAGWDLDGSFRDHLVIGFSGDSISLLAHKEWWGADDPLLEILDHEAMANYWVREIPTPERAKELLGEHARQPQEWDRP